MELASYYLVAGKGVFVCYFPSPTELARFGPGNPAPSQYLPYTEAAAAVDYEYCIPLMDAYDPLKQVILVAVRD